RIERADSGGEGLLRVTPAGNTTSANPARGCAGQGRQPADALHVRPGGGRERSESMSWNYDDSKERIGNHLDNMGEIEVEKLVREADLNSLLSETKCRQIHGAHIYVHVTNFSRIASESVADE